MTVLIFGINGQDGYYLREYLLASGVDVVGVHRSGTEGIAGDVEDYACVRRLIAEYKPRHVVHFAANSTTRHDAVFENHASIATGTLNVLEAVHSVGCDARVFITGSGVQFLNQARPVHEADPFDATSPYAVARIHSVYTARYYRSLGVRVYIGYLFHHESPRRKATHTAKRIADTARRIAAGSTESLRLGDISIFKEWGFARDIAEAVWIFMNQDKNYEAVIGTGKGHTIEEWVDACFSSVGLDYRRHLEIIPNFIPEYRYLVSSPTTIQALGWKPKLEMSSLARLMTMGSNQ